MNILFAHNDYARPSGEEYALESLASLMNRDGQSIAWFRRSSAEIGNLLSGKAKAFFAGIANHSSVRKLEAVLENEPPDLVLIQNLYPLLSPSVLSACKKRSIPIVMRCPNYRLFCPNGLHLSHNEICERCLCGKEYWCILRNCEGNLFKSTGYALRNAVARISGRILDNVDTFIVLSEFQKRRFMDQGIPEEKLAILPNIAPVKDAKTPQLADDLSLGDFVGFVGRISREKGIEDFVFAAKALPNLQFAVAGATDQMPELVLQSPKNVKWFGFINDNELKSFYKQCRIVVCPSRCFEGFPNSVNQAMATDKPVIASNLGALPEIVEKEKTGLLFEAGNVRELTKTISDLYSDPDRCRAYGKAGRAKAETEYSEDAVYKRLMKIIERTMSRHRSTLNV